MKKILIIFLLLGSISYAMDKIAALRVVEKQYESAQKQAQNDQLARAFSKEIFSIKDLESNPQLSNFGLGLREELIKKINNGTFDGLLEKSYHPSKKDLGPGVADGAPIHPFFSALTNGNSAILRALLERSLKIPNHLTFNEQISTPPHGKMEAPIFILLDWLNTQSLHQRIHKIQLLMEHGVDLNAMNFNGLTPLMVAASKAQVPVVQLLITGVPKARYEQLPELRKPDSYLGLLPVELVQKTRDFLNNQADPNIRTANGNTALSLARLKATNLQDADREAYQQIITILEPLTSAQPIQPQVNPQQAQPQQSWWQRWLGQ